MAASQYCNPRFKYPNGLLSSIAITRFNCIQIQRYSQSIYQLDGAILDTFKDEKFDCYEITNLGALNPLLQNAVVYA